MTLVLPAAFRTQRHGVVAGDDADDVRVLLWDGLHATERLGLTPISALLRHHFKVSVVVQHVLIALRAHAGVGVRLFAQQFNVAAFAVKQFGELLRAELSILIIIGDDLRHGDAGFVDLPVNEELPDTDVFGFMHRSDSGIRASVVENNRLRLARGGGFNQLVLLADVIVVRRHSGGVTERFGFFLRAGRLRF